MEPIPETTEAIEEFGPFSYDGDLLEQLTEKADAVESVVPDCVGLSLASCDEGVTFTLVASRPRAAMLDAVQYLDGGPCVEAVETEQVLSLDSLDEGGWQYFAQAGAAVGVASSLTLPIVVDGTVTGSVNLYAASPDAFSGHHEELARIFDAWAPGAVTNADLSFSTLDLARRAPQQLRDDYNIQVAAGILAGGRSDLEGAVQRLHDAATRAGITAAQLAATIIGLKQTSSGE